MVYEALTQAEITALERQGCRAADWQKVAVARPFRIDHYRDVEFVGTVRLGTTEKVHRFDGIDCASGVYNCCLANVTIGNDVLLRNVDRLSATGSSSFGNGMRIEVLDETGGIAIPVAAGMSAQLAAAFVEGRQGGDDAPVAQFLSAITAAVDDAAAASRRDGMTVGTGARIVNSGRIIDTVVGNDAVVDGALSLENGSIGDRSTVGAGVIARDFIVESDARVENGVNLNHVFVGQGCRLGNGFTAHQSIFFANCIMENGEAAAVFAGPHCVSMHKSTLLIGGMFSFFNAGSGTNMSNHLYKSGPIHYGIMERGCKMGSDSYVMWPARIGMFSMVVGRHYKHPVTTCYPFSYLLSCDGQTRVVPGATIAAVGTYRDLRKWPQRDNRPAENRVDIIDTSVATPAVLSALVAGYERLLLLTAEDNAVDGFYIDGDLLIRERDALRGVELYETAIDFCLGRFLAEGGRLAPGTPCVDLAGASVPLAECNLLFASKTPTLAELNRAVADSASRQRRLLPPGVCDYLRRRFGHAIPGLRLSEVAPTGNTIAPDDKTEAELRAAIQAASEAAAERLRVLFIADADSESTLAPGNPAIATLRTTLRTFPS